MANQYDVEMLRQINDSVNLLDYVSQTYELKKRGRNYFTRCPFHVDNTPSLSFSPNKNSFRCFSCGRHGKLIGYLMKYEGLSMDEAVEKGAKLGSINLSTMQISDTLKFLRSAKAAKNSPKPAYDHATINEDILNKYSKKYPQLWLDEGITKESMDKFGILVDEWGNRIVYPVRDMAGRLINVKGRTMYDKYKSMGIQKYANYFKVGVMDYFQGLDITLPDIKEKGEVIVFESIKSVMKADGWGYKNCVSAEKHTLTSEQVRLLIQLRVDVVLAWDSDVDYYKEDVRESINKLRRLTNLYIIQDKDKLLGGAETKNAPVDLGKDIWEELYAAKRKVV